MTQAKVRIDPALAALTRSEWERLIYEANLGVENAEIAHRYFIDKQCQIDIAIDKDIDRKTIGRKITAVKTQLRNTYNRVITS